MAYPAHYLKSHLKTERDIVDRLIRAALDRGYLISVHDGEEYTAVKRSADYEAITAEVAATDETIFVIRTADHVRLGSVTLIHGNDADVISDYTDNAELAALILWVEMLGICAREVDAQGRPWQPKALSLMIEEARALGRPDLVDDLTAWGERWTENVYTPKWEAAMRGKDDPAPVVADTEDPKPVLGWIQMQEDGAAPMMVPLADWLEANTDLEAADFYDLLAGKTITAGGGAQPIVTITLTSLG